MNRFFPAFLITFCLFAACADAPTPPTAVSQQPITPPPTPLITPSPTPTPTASPTPLPTPTPTATPIPIIISAQTAVPAPIINHVQALTGPHTPFAWSDDPAQADLLLTINDGTPLTHWLYVVAAPFATVADDISWETINTGWSSGQTPLGPLLPSADSQPLTAVFQTPPAHNPIHPAELSATLWAQRPALTLLPFHQLTPDLKLLSLNGHSPLDPTFDPSSYPLQINIGVVGDETAVSQLQTHWHLPSYNYNPNQLTQIALTGVTALVRATAHQIELNGINYPIRDVAPVLRQADYAHISNEVAFAPNCPFPNPIGGTSFCSRESYFTLLQEIGIDIVELTGNHLNDWGRDNLLHTLDLYEQAGLLTFGGGRNSDHAATPLLLHHNGNNIALVGCNPYGPTYAWATTSSAGARSCDETIHTQIAQLKDKGYQVLATQQYAEYYHYAATPQQQADFRRLIDAGATAVSGSQGHHAQGFDFYNGGFIHYGLGNLFFDQMDMIGTRQTFIDTYSFYNGRLLNITLWTGLIENYAYPRQTTPSEREQALQALFQASGW